MDGFHDTKNLSDDVDTWNKFRWNELICNDKNQMDLQPDLDTNGLNASSLAATNLHTSISAKVAPINANVIFEQH